LLTSPERIVRRTFTVVLALLVCGGCCAHAAAQPLAQPVAGIGLAEDVTPIAIGGDTASLDGCQVIARIEGQVVLACEVLWEVNKVIEQNADRIPPERVDMIRQQLLEGKVVEILDRKLVYAEFRRNFPAENLPKLEESLQQPFDEDEVPRLMKGLGVDSREALERELVRLGSSLADVRRTFQEREVVRFWVRSKVKINEEISPDEMLEYYRSHQADFEFATQARWEELTVRKNRFASPAQAFAELASMGNEVWQRAAAKGGLNGPAFVEVAKARSDGFNAKDGGQYDWTHKGALKAANIDQALFTLQVGQMSPILESDMAFHIIRVLERKEAGRKPFTEVQGEIREKLKEQRFQTAVAAYLGKRRRDARVWTASTGNVSADVLMSRAQSATQAR
jgi:parvulin-like peptidyl-prolyl isomerase